MKLSDCPGNSKTNCYKVQPTFPLSPTDLTQPGKGEHRSLQINTTVSLISPGDPQNNTIMRSLTAAMTAQRYPEEAWVHVYTDGSATDSVTSEGAVRFPKGEVQPASIPPGKYCSFYMAEIQALVQAASVARDSSNECQQVVLSDALSVLEATADDKLPRLASQTGSLQWLPVHVVFQEMKKRTSSPNMEPKEDSKTTLSPFKKRRASSEQLCGTSPREMTSTSLTGGSRLLSWWSRWQQAVAMVVTAAAGYGHVITHGPQPTQCPHGQENEAGTITSKQLWS